MIACGLSSAFHNKQNLTGKQSAYGSSFQPVEVDLPDLVAHIIGGRAFTVGYFQGLSRRKETFVSAQMLALDLDSGLPSTSIPELLKNPFIRDYAALLYPTPSHTEEHPKTRVLFILDEPVDHRDRWEALQRGLLTFFADIDPDSACKDSARLFYGSDLGGRHINLGARLPLTIAGGLTGYEAEADYLQRTAGDAPPARYTGNDGQYIESYLEAAINAELAELAATGRGGRNQQTFKSGCAVFGFVKGGYLSESGVRADLERAALQTGLPENEVKRTLDSAWSNATPRYVPEKPPQVLGKRDGKTKKSLQERIHPVAQIAFPADTTRSERYISDAIDPDLFTNPGAYLIKSGIGTGKTELVKRAIAQLEKQLGHPPKVLIGTHRQALAEDIARRYGVEYYKEMPREFIGQATQLAIVYNSLPKLLQEGKLPQYDLVIIDEIEQMPGHLGGGTFREGQATQVYAIVRQLIVQTPRFIALDAHLNTTTDWLKSLRDDVFCIENRYTSARGPLTLHEHDSTVTATALRLAQEGTVVISTDSKKEARKLEAFFKSRLGDDAVYMICGDNSENTESQAFIADINNWLPNLKVFIYTPSLGSGVDITAPVRAACLISKGDHLPATGLHQLLGRCRNVQETHACVRSHRKRYETDSQVLYTNAEQAAIQTGRACEFNKHGVLGISSILRESLELISKSQAAANQQRNDLLSHFVARAEGYLITYREGRDENTQAALKNIKNEIDEHDKQATIEAAPVDYDEMDLHRQNGTLTPEIRYGHERYKIENTVGLVINEKIYDDLHTQTARQHLRRFTDQLTAINELRDSDRAEANMGKPLHQRQHKLLIRRLIEQAIRDVFGLRGLENDDEFSGETIEERLQGFIDLFRDELHRYLGWRPDQSQKPVALLRWILGKIGVHLDSRQVMRDGERFQLYRLNRGDVIKQTRYAAARQAHLRKKQAENAITKNVDIKIKQPRVDIPPGIGLRGNQPIWERPLPSMGVL